MKGKTRFGSLDEVLDYIKKSDNEKIHGYKIMYDDGKWSLKKWVWTPFGMKYKWVEV